MQVSVYRNNSHIYGDTLSIYKKCYNYELSYCLSRFKIINI